MDFAFLDKLYVMDFAFLNKLVLYSNLLKIVKKRTRYSFYQKQHIFEFSFLAQKLFLYEICFHLALSDV